MKRLVLIAAAFALPACTSTGSSGAGNPNNPPPINTDRQAFATADRVMVPTGKALIVAHNAYQAAAAAATLAVQSGVITGDNLTRLEALNNRARYLLSQADAGYNVGQNAAEVINIVTDIRSMIGG